MRFLIFRCLSLLGAALMLVALPQVAVGNNAVPSISSLSPLSVHPGGSAFQLTVRGTGFVPNSVIRWNGSDRMTTYVSNTELTASISSTDIQSSGTAWITVFNSGPGGGSSSNSFVQVSAPLGQLSFTESSNPVGSAPQGIATADFNGDHILDLAVTNVFSCSVSVMLGLSDGSFQARNDYSSGCETTFVTTGDMNSDGKIDLVVSNHGPDTVSVLLGNGDGTFGPSIPASTGVDPIGVALGDLNADGNLDVVVANFVSSTLSVFLGNGNGTLGSQSQLATANGPVMVSLADLNGDGKLDIVVGCTNSDVVSVFLANGDGTFGSRTDVPAGDGTLTATPADLNGDGSLDLIIVNGNSDSVSILVGNGDGTFLPGVVLAVGNTPQPALAGDFNADGKLDVLISNLDSNSVSIFLGNGDGTFGLRNDFSTGSYPWWAASGDFDGDGKLDLATANRFADTVSVLLNSSQPIVQRDFFLHGSGGLNNPPTLFLDTSAPSSSTATFRDSPAVHFAGGNLWKEIGTWTASPNLASGDLSALGHLNVWLGLKNSDDQGTRFDLRAEVQKNGVLIASGETYCITGVTRNPSLAKEILVSLGGFGAVSFDGSSDEVSIKVLTRIGTNATGGFCGGHSNAVGLRLYFDSVTRQAQFSASFF